VSYSEKAHSHVGYYGDLQGFKYHKGIYFKFKLMQEVYFFCFTEYPSGYKIQTMKKMVSTYFRLMICLVIVFVLISCRIMVQEDKKIIHEEKDPEMSSTMEMRDQTENDSELEQSETDDQSVETTPSVVIDSIFMKGVNPVLLQNLLAEANLTISSSESGSFTLQQVKQFDKDENQLKTFQWVYLLVSPFPTANDSIQFTQLIQLWVSKPAPEAKFQSLILDQATYEIFRYLWGESGEHVIVVDEADLQAISWERGDSITILPFENLNPKWKVIQLGGVSPLDHDFRLKDYPLVIYFEIPIDEIGAKYSIDSLMLEKLSKLPPGNFYPEDLTSVMLTGVTALVRKTAEKMEQNGYYYPASDLGELFGQVDLLHISNEVPFYSECPSAVPPRAGGRFCSDPAYIELFEKIGVDIIELTGNHLLDYGEKAFTQTLELYLSKGFRYYGGGYDLANAEQPLLVEVKGNKFAFLGCNVPGPESVFAGEENPGAAECNFDDMSKQINALRNSGYQVIVTIQHYEACQFEPMSAQRLDFKRAANAGAVIVSGSQAHCPQGMTFGDNTFIHYGLGNLFFDQMYSNYRPEFLDEHYFYQGKYINTVLHTAILEDYAKPRLMTTEERKAFLDEVFGACSW